MLRRALTDLTTVLTQLGVRPGRVHAQLPTPTLYEHAVRRGEGMVAQGGPLVVSTGACTGRAADDKYFVRDAGTESRVRFGAANKPITPEQFQRLRERVLGYLSERELYLQELSVGADPEHRLPVR